MWTVAALREALDGYADDLVVRVDVEHGNRTVEHVDFDVSDATTAEEVVVTLTVDAS